MFAAVGQTAISMGQVELAHFWTSAMDAFARKPVASRLGQAIALFICIAIAAVAIAIDIRTAKFSQDYDEGVYWQSLRAMSAGYHLYGQIFCSQPPFFLLSIYPFYTLLGSTIASARVGVATLSLLGLIGAYLMGKALAGRPGGIATVILLIVTPMCLAQSHVLQAEAPATAFLFLTIGAALMWWEHPTGRRGMAFAVLCAVALSLGLLIKLLVVTAAVPMLLLVLARIWHIRHETSPRVWASLLPIAAAMVAAVIATLIILAPFLESLNALIQQVVTFHLGAEKGIIASDFGEGNIHTLGRFFATSGVLSTVAIIGVAVTVMRRDWRIVPLLAWFLATLIVLIIHVPLFPRHAIVLIPPLIAIVALGLKDLPEIPMRRPIVWEQRAALLMGLLAFAVVIFSLRQDYHHYRNLRTRAASTADQRMAQVAVDLERVTTPDQWIITDAQFAAAMASRDTPPWLVDTSTTRVLSGYLTSQELLQAAADPRVHAVVFATNRLTLAPIASFYPWVTEHFNLLRTYDTGIELWTR
jgi:4-amino-4-deoxy-L-arabinose transferase-like glycosyltransferase